jgi:membrane-bound inhibitor of C-type lysozyme
MLISVRGRSSRMRTRPSTPRNTWFSCVVALAATLVLAACANTPGKDEQEAARNTFACQLSGERLVIRFDVGEARLLMPDADRVVLYQIPSASGVRFSNGKLELRGKGTDLQLVRDGTATQLADCQPYPVPAK